MATWQEAEKQLQDLQAQREALGKANAQPNGTVIVDGKTYSRANYEKLVKDFDKKISSLEKALAPLRSAQAGLARAKEIAASPITEAPTGMSQAEAQKAVTDAQAKVDELTKADYAVPGVAVPATPVGPGRGKAVGPTAAEMKAAIAARQKPGAKPKEPTTPTVAGGGGAKTPASGGAGAVAKLPADWKTKFREMFPAQAWLVDVDPAKYPGLQKVLQDAYKGRMWETTDGQQRFSLQLDGTDFFKELKTNNIVRDIKTVVGDLGFDQTPFNSFLTNAMNMGWKGETLKYEAYKEVFRQDENTGQYVNPTAVNRVKKSTPWLRIAKIGTDFFSQVADKTIADVLSGNMAEDDVIRQQRELAKTKYAHLSNLIDQGFSLDDLSTSFKNTAARMLEVDPNTINMPDTKWEVALNYGEEGKKRMMTTGEWEKLLRTDKQYNWDKTENAKAEARQLASTISQAFGRVL